ncbi:MAG: deoxynucleoside kinase [Ferruginibacter sp.]|nr:deoxynucleoside kinase [Ferruginibacter sp.]
MNYRFITVEGNIGAGKTTLSSLLSKHYHARLVLEAFADNPFLPSFYKNPEQYAFPLELFFMAERYKQWKEVLQAPDMFHQITISDYLFTKSLLFARVNLKDDEYKLYQRLFDIINPQILQPEILIFLNAPIKKLQENIRKRNRGYELSISDEYLQSIQDIYTEYLKQHSVKTLMVDTSNADFLNNPEHFQVITNALEHEYEPGVHYLTLP